jgi:hypothetical protein
VFGCLPIEEVNVAQGVGRLMRGEIGSIERPPAGRLSRMGLHQDRAVVEADNVTIGSSPEGLADQACRQGIERLRHLSEVIAMDLGITPQRDVVRLGGCRQQGRFLFGVEVLEGHAVRASMAPCAVLVKAPLPRMLAGVVEIAKLFTAKAIVPDGRDGALDASLVLGMAHACRVDVKAAGLRVFQEGRVDRGLKGIGVLDDRLRVVGNDYAEDAAVERPGRFAGFDRLRRRFRETRIDEAQTRHARREDPRPHSSASTLGIGLKQDHPTRIELDFVPGLAVGDGDRRRGPTEVELRDSETVQSGVRNRNTLSNQQAPNLGKPDASIEEFLDRRALSNGQGPAVAVGPATVGAQGDQHGAQVLIGQAGWPRANLDSVRLSDLDVATYRFGVQTHLAGDLFLRCATDPQPQNFLHFEHSHLAIRHLPSRLGQAEAEQGGRWPCSPARRGERY